MSVICLGPNLGEIMHQLLQYGWLELPDDFHAIYSESGAALADALEADKWTLLENVPVEWQTHLRQTYGNPVTFAEIMAHIDAVPNPNTGLVPHAIDPKKLMGNV